MHEYVLADGSKHKNESYLLHSITLGGRVVNDVVVAIGPDNSAPLLGESVLEKFGFDYQRNVLRLGTPPQGGVQDVASAAPPTAPAPAPQAMQPPAIELPGDERPDVRKIATVRAGPTLVYSEPDQSSRVIAGLTPGSSVVVHRLFWNMLLQWAEVEVGSGIGFVVTTDVELSPR
jgi:hypothetical protein